MSKYSKIKTKGYTLLEVIIATTIILIIGTAFSKVAFTSIKVTNANMIKLQAINLAQNQMEKIRDNNNGFSNISELKNLLANEGFINLQKDIKIEGYAYTISVNAEENNLTYGNIVSVKIIVGVKDSANKKVADPIEISSKMYLK